MKTSKPTVKYQGISIPITLIDEIKKYILKHPEYRSISEFVRQAIRKEMEKDDSVQSELKELKEETHQMSGYIKQLIGFGNVKNQDMVTEAKGKQVKVVKDPKTMKFKKKK